MLKRLHDFIDGSTLTGAAHREVVASLYPRSFRIGTSFVTASVNGVVLASVMQSWLPLAWMVVALALCLYRTWDWSQYHRAPASRTSSDWARRFVFRFFPFGMWWGATAALLFLSDDPLLIAIAVLATDAQSAGAVCSYPGHPPAALAFVVPSMMMFAIAGVIRGGALGYSITFVEIMLMINYLIIIREFYRTAVGALVLRDEKSALAENLAETHLALQREGAAKSEFLAHMSHEFRTPLNAIIGFSDVMGNEVFGPINNVKYAEYLDDIHSAARHLLNIVNEVLDIARIEAGELNMVIDATDPAYIARFAATLVEQRAQYKRLVLDIRIDPVLNDKSLQTDEVRLKQAIINILSNAIKFTNSGGTVKLSAGIRDNSVFYEVSDTGVGMSPEDLTKALLPFVQVGSPMLAREGTGLGLPLSRQLTEKLGGSFVIVSAEGVGTTVTITIPLPA